MGLLDKLFSRKPKMEEFAKIVQAALAMGGVSGLKFNPADSSIRVESMDRTFYLDNAYRDYCQAETSGDRAERLRRYVSSFLEAPTMPKDFGDVKEHLMPIVRDPAYYSLVTLKIRADGGDASKLSTPLKSIARGLVAGVAYDTEKSIMNVNDSSLADWGLTLDQALELGIEHLRNRTSDAGFKEIIPGLYISQFGDSYDSARLLLPDLLYRLKVNGDPVVFVPNRDQVWVTGAYDSGGIGTILQHGPEGHFNSGHNLSPNLYLLSDGKLGEYVPENPQQREAARAIQRQRELTDYQQQTGYLQKINELEKRDIFVAAYTLYKRKDQSTFSVGVWSNEVDTLLPKTDYIAFMVSPVKKEHFQVAWDEAFSIAGSLMEVQPELEPVRYRVRKFPDAVQLAMLKERAKAAEASS